MKSREREGNLFVQALKKKNQKGEGTQNFTTLTHQLVSFTSWCLTSSALELKGDSSVIYVPLGTHTDYMPHREELWGDVFLSADFFLIEVKCIEHKSNNHFKVYAFQWRSVHS